jgi:hypothetical protein
MNEPANGYGVENTSPVPPPLLVVPPPRIVPGAQDIPPIARTQPCMHCGALQGWTLRNCGVRAAIRRSLMGNLLESVHEITLARFTVAC